MTGPGGRPAIPAPVAAVARSAVYHGSRVLVRRRLALAVEGTDHVPAAGPVLIACRHYHHVWDGFVLLSALPRHLHFVIALDWIEHRPLRVVMEGAAAALDWPVVVRTDGLPATGRSVYRPEDAPRYLRQAARASVSLLRAGRTVVIFPEGYPTVDTVFTRKQGDEALPFRPGYLSLAEGAQRHGPPVAIVPAGLHYRRGRRWDVTLRFGSPRDLTPDTNRDVLNREIEAEVERLSRPPR